MPLKCCDQFTNSDHAVNFLTPDNLDKRVRLDG